MAEGLARTLDVSAVGTTLADAPSPPVATAVGFRIAATELTIADVIVNFDAVWRGQPRRTDLVDWPVAGLTVDLTGLSLFRADVPPPANDPVRAATRAAPPLPVAPAAPVPAAPPAQIAPAAPVAPAVPVVSAAPAPPVASAPPAAAVADEPVAPVLSVALEVPPVEAVEPVAVEVVAPAEAVVAEPAAPEAPAAPSEPEAPAEPVALAAPVAPAEPVPPPPPDIPAAVRALAAIIALPSGGAQPQERLFASEALIDLIDRASPLEIVNIARKIARLDTVSPILVRRLITHAEHRAARILLDDGAAVTDADLLALVRAGDPAHHRGLARRRNLPAHVAAELAAKGDIAIILDLLRNTSIALDYDTLRAVAALAAEEESLQSTLATRNDLPQAVALELFWHVPPAVRRYLLSRFLTESEALDHSLAAAGAAGVVPAVPGRGDVEAASAVATGIAAGDPATPEALSRLLGTDPATARRIVADRGGEPLTVAFKSLGFPRAAFQAASRAWVAAPASAIDSSRDPEDFSTLFDTLSFNKARMLLAYWEWHSRGVGPYAAAPAPAK